MHERAGHMLPSAAGEGRQRQLSIMLYSNMLSTKLDVAAYYRPALRCKKLLEKRGFFLQPSMKLVYRGLSLFVDVRFLKKTE